MYHPPYHNQNQMDGINKKVWTHLKPPTFVPARLIK